MGGLGGEKVDAGSCVDCLDISIVLFDFFFLFFLMQVIAIGELYKSVVVIRGSSRALCKIHFHNSTES